MILGPYMLRLRHNTSWMDNLSDELRAGYTERLNGERGWIGKLEEAMKENTLEFEQDRDMRKERRDARRQIIEVMFQIAKAEESFMMGERGEPTRARRSRSSPPLLTQPQMARTKSQSSWETCPCPAAARGAVLR